MTIYTERREQHLAQLCKLRPHLKIKGWETDRASRILIQCSLCKATSVKPVKQWLSYDCPCLRASKISASSRMSQEQVKEWLAKQQLRLLETYTTMNTPTRVKCLACGNKWAAFLGNVRAGHGCSVCAQERIREHNLKVYGVEWASQRPEVQKKIRKTMRKRYGVNHALQNPALFEKNITTAMGWKDYQLGSRVVKVQGYEPSALDYIRSKGIAPSKIVCGKGSAVPRIKYRYAGRNKIYHPDIWIPSLNRLIEVKSEYTYSVAPQVNASKRKAAIAQGFDFMFLVMGRNGQHCSTRLFRADKTIGA